MLRGKNQMIFASQSFKNCFSIKSLLSAGSEHPAFLEDQEDQAEGNDHHAKDDDPCPA